MHSILTWERNTGSSPVFMVVGDALAWTLCTINTILSNSFNSVCKSNIECTIDRPIIKISSSNWWLFCLQITDTTSKCSDEHSINTTFCMEPQNSMYVTSFLHFHKHCFVISIFSRTISKCDDNGCLFVLFYLMMAMYCCWGQRPSSSVEGSNGFGWLWRPNGIQGQMWSKFPDIRLTVEGKSKKKP